MCRSHMQSVWHSPCQCMWTPMAQAQSQTRRYWHQSSGPLTSAQVCRACVSLSNFAAVETCCFKAAVACQSGNGALSRRAVQAAALHLMLPCCMLHAAHCWRMWLHCQCIFDQAWAWAQATGHTIDGRGVWQDSLHETWTFSVRATRRQQHMVTSAGTTSTPLHGRRSRN